MQIHHGDCLEVLRTMPDASVDSIVTDPPYGLAFMGKHWDYDVPSLEIWAECLRVLKPGGHLLAFAGTRTQHRMAVRIEDAGFEIRDMIAWVYGSGFPKSLDVSKAIDKRGGASVAWFGPWFRKWREERGVTQKQVSALFPSKTGNLTGCVANWELGFNMPTPEQFNLIRDTFGLPFDSVEEAEREVIGQRTAGIGTGGGSTPIMGDGNRDITAPATDAAKQWQGWGTALKPALEPITVARKPLGSTVAECVLAHGTGAINVDGCRVGTAGGDDYSHAASTVKAHNGFDGAAFKHTEKTMTPPNSLGRWPANLIHDGSEEVLAGFPDGAPAKAGRTAKRGGSNWHGRDGLGTPEATGTWPADPGGSAARFFYCAKASKRDRDEGLEGFELKPSYMVENGSKTAAAANGVRYDRTTKQRNNHPTVKPTDLMRYLCRLVTPPGGVVLDPFMGTGSTGKAAVLEGFRFIGIEREAAYIEIARARISHAQATPKQEALL